MLLRRTPAAGDAVKLQIQFWVLLLNWDDLSPRRTFTSPIGPKRSSVRTATARTPSPKTSTALTATATWQRDHSTCGRSAPTANAGWKKPRACWETRPLSTSSLKAGTTPNPGRARPSCQALQHQLRGPIRVCRRRCPGWRQRRSSGSARSVGRRPSQLCPEPRAGSAGSRS